MKWLTAFALLQYQYNVTVSTTSLALHISVVIRTNEVYSLFYCPLSNLASLLCYHLQRRCWRTVLRFVFDEEVAKCIIEFNKYGTEKQISTCFRRLECLYLCCYYQLSLYWF